MEGLDTKALSCALKFVGLTAAGVYAGGAAYINIVEVPANLSRPMEVAVDNWQDNFGYASHRLPIIHSISMASALGSYVLSYGTDKEDLPFALAPVVGLLNVPFTLMFLMPTNRILQKPEACKEKGDDYIREHLERWNCLHAVRTGISVGVFAFMAYRIMKGAN